MEDRIRIWVISTRHPSLHKVLQIRIQAGTSDGSGIFLWGRDQIGLNICNQIQILYPLIFFVNIYVKLLKTYNQNMLTPPSAPKRL